MSMRICVSIPSKPGEVTLKPRRECFDIPVLLVTYPWRPPRPFFSRVADAIRLVVSPRPAPWVPSGLVKSGLGEETIRDARVLATVSALMEELSPTLRDSLASSVTLAAKQLALPQSGELTMTA